MKTYTVEQFKKYLKMQDSLGDVLYNLSEENIDKANKEQPLLETYSRMLAIKNETGYTSEEKFQEIFALANNIRHLFSYERDIDSYLKAFEEYLKYDLGLDVNGYTN